MSPSKEKQDFLLMLIVAITKQKGKDKEDQKKYRIKIKDKIKGSPELLKMFENDCQQAEKNESTSSRKLECYFNYVYGMND